jgi:hypothetical protein
MTFLGGHDAQVALRKAAETWVTIALTETFPDCSPTVDTLNLLQVFNADLLTQPLVQMYLLTAKFKAITDRTGSLGKHFVQISLKLHSSPVKSEDRFTEGG